MRFARCELERKPGAMCQCQPHARGHVTLFTDSGLAQVTRRTTQTTEYFWGGVRVLLALNYTKKCRLIRLLCSLSADSRCFEKAKVLKFHEF